MIFIEVIVNVFTSKRFRDIVDVSIVDVSINIKLIG